MQPSTSRDKRDIGLDSIGQKRDASIEQFKIEKRNFKIGERLITRKTYCSHKLHT